MRMRCFFCVEGRHFSTAVAAMKRSGGGTNLVELRDALRSPSTPGEKDDAAAAAGAAAGARREVRTAPLVDDIDDFIGELFPPLVRVGPRLARLHGQSRIEQQDPVLGPGSKVPAHARTRTQKKEGGPRADLSARAATMMQSGARTHAWAG